MNEQNNPILEVKNLRVSYHTYAGEVKAVRGVQFSLEKGQALAIVGESGCGKSVTAKSIMGLIKAPQGEIKENSEILYNGENILKYNKKQWQHYKGGECAIIFQDALASLNPTMRVGKQIMENLMGHKNMTKQEAAKEAVEMLRMVGIPEPEKRVRQYPHEFSGGMRQRVMIAIAFACDPKILICDEPTTALDVTIQGQILDIIKNLQKKNQMVNLHGVDVRIMNEEQAFYLSKLKLKRRIHIAWDLPEIDLTEKLREVTKYIKPRNLSCYVLVGFNSTVEQDMYRLNRLKELGISPFVQPYRDFNNNRKPTLYEKDIAQWANKHQIFKTCDFADFSPRKGFKCNYYLNR